MGILRDRMASVGTQNRPLVITSKPANDVITDSGEKTPENPQSQPN